MPIATRGQMQGQIPFQCRKTRSQALCTKQDSAIPQTRGMSSKKSTKSSSKKQPPSEKAVVESTRDTKIRARGSSRQTRCQDAIVESASGEWQVSPRKRQITRESSRKESSQESECSPRKLKKENVPVHKTKQCLSPRKNCQVNVENGGILKDVQNSPRKEGRTRDFLEDIVEAAFVDDNAHNSRTFGSENSPGWKRSKLVLPGSPCKRITSPHKRALSFNFQDEPEQSCSSRSSPRKAKKENHPAATGALQDIMLPISPVSKGSTSRRKSVALGLQRQHGECYQKAKQALHTSVPDRLLCRDKETKAISSFLQDHLGKKKAASMYISGAPGTGKTACLSSIMKEKKDLMKSTQTIYINCMSVKQSQHIYRKVLSELSKGKDANKTKAKEVVAKLEKEFTKSGPMVLLVMDEIDHLDSKNQEVLYTMFEWPSLRKSRLVLIGIANALDLTDRILPRLQARPKCKPQLLHFAPYTKDQISTILKDRLTESLTEDSVPIVEPMAVQFCARKVAAVAGDIRKALDVCRRAVELVENDVCRQTVLKMVSGSPRKSVQGSPRKCLAGSPKKLPARSPRKSPRKALLMSPSKSPRKALLKSPSKSPAVKKVGLIQISNVISEVYGSCLTSSSSESQTFPLQQKLIICTVLLMVKKGKFKEVTVGKLHEMYSKVCRGRHMMPVDQSECLSLCQLIETRGILGMKKAKDARQTKICLKLDEKELEFALQDKVLVSSILKEGLPSKKK